MSILLMTAAFKAQMRPTQKLVLLALCDSANDQGECYPSVATLVEKSSASERTVQDCISSLVEEGYMSRSFRNGRSTVYQVTDPRKWRTPAAVAPPQLPHPTPAIAAPPPPQTAHPTPANGAPITVKEPSIEPKKREARQVALICPADVAEQVWADWLSLRRGKRAAVTATVLDGARTEAAKAGLTLEAFLRVWCRRGSQGLEAEWLKPNERGHGAPPGEPEWRRMQRERNEQFLGPAAAKRSTTQPEFINEEPPRLVG